MRAQVLAFAALTMLTVSATAQNRDIDLSTFIKATTPAGTLVQDPEAPVSFHLAPGWELTHGMRWGDHETTLSFKESGGNTVTSLYYQYPLQPKPSGDPYATLENAMMDKVHERVEREGIADYRIRPGSLQKRQIGGQPALSFIAEFTGSFMQNGAVQQTGGEAKVEYMVRVLGNATNAHFFVMGVPATADIDAICSRLEPIVTTLRIP